MRLDQPASRALNLFPAPTDSTLSFDCALSLRLISYCLFLADKTFSLYGMLNKCRTAMGSRRLLQWIKQPLLNINDIGTRALANTDARN